MGCLQDASSLSYASALLWHGGFQALQMQRIAHAFWERGERTAALRIQARWRCCDAPYLYPWAMWCSGSLLR